MVKVRSLSLKVLSLVALGTGLLVIGVAYLFVDISEKKAEEKRYPLLIQKVSDEDVRPSVWGQSFPAQYSRYREMKDSVTPTTYGGSLPYSKLIRNPSMVSLWAGYPFSADFNEERSHYYSQIDQMETKRNDQEWLNQHGFPMFKGQPGACMNCHSGWAPALIRELGWETFNKTPYKDLKKRLEEKHGPGIEGHALGSTCADCHSPTDWSLRVTRPAYIQAMKMRGYEEDPQTGLKANHQEMRSHVCQQCHVEYYFNGPDKTLTFPWADWPKDKPLAIEMIETYYDRQREGNGFKEDWVHKESHASMLKMQHPETELYSSGVHAKSGVACADCHMPYRREGAVKVTEHLIRSPLLNVNASCQTCHRMEEQKLKERVDSIQTRTAQGLKEAEGAILALIKDLGEAEKLLRKSNETSQKRADAELESWVKAVLEEPREAHRRSSMRWDFISSENSTGFHSPQEAMRVLSSAIQIARTGQLKLVQVLQKEDLTFTPTAGYGPIPPAPSRISEHHSPVGDPPPQSLMEHDSKVLLDSKVLRF